MEKQAQGRGHLIVLEGMDGSGTTTQAALLSEWLIDKGFRVTTTREPTDGPVGRFLRSALRGELSDERAHSVALDWAAMALLFAADRVDHVTRTILPALSRGEIVISDRYYLSSLLYQSMTSPQEAQAIAWLRSINGQAQKPDLTIVVDLSEDVAAARRALRGGKPELYEYAELQRKLSEGYRRAESFVPDDALRHVDGSQPVADVTDQIVKIIEEFLGIRSHP
jgi:dTMP kinase